MTSILTRTINVNDVKFSSNSGTEIVIPIPDSMPQEFETLIVCVFQPIAKPPDLPEASRVSKSQPGSRISVLFLPPPPPPTSLVTSESQGVRNKSPFLALVF
jgi:hypothetical protein